MVSRNTVPVRRMVVLALCFGDVFIPTLRGRGEDKCRIEHIHVLQILRGDNILIEREERDTPMP